MELKIYSSMQVSTKNKLIDLYLNKYIINFNQFSILFLKQEID